MPLNVFEPRYLAMVDDVLAGRRLIGIIQPTEEAPPDGPPPALYQVGCAGRVTQWAETGDGRYLVTLTGVARFTVAEEISVTTLYRQAKVDYAFPIDFSARAGEDEVDREGVIAALAAFVKANQLKIDWRGVQNAPNEALVNALSMMSPYGAKEKQALLEAPDLKARADMLIAITEIELARDAGSSDTSLQ
jgi:Lon protease-like protein